MNPSPRRRLPAAGLVLLSAAWLLSAPAAWGQGTAQAAVPWEGTEAFRFLLFNRGVRALSEVTDLVERPDQTMLIFLGGDAAAVNDVPGGLWAFVREGGAVLIATDQRTDPGVEKAFGVRVRGESLLAVNRKEDGYRDRAECPVVTDFTRPVHPVFRGLTGLATNKPSFLQAARRTPFRTRATFPLVESAGKAWQLQFAAFFAMTWDGPGGRVLMLSDDSVFINGMMLQPDNDNLRFANQAMDWLTEGGRRTQALVVVAAKVDDRFDKAQTWLPLLGLGTPDLKDLPPVNPADLPPPPVEVLDRMVVGLEDEDVFNELIRRSVGVPRMWKGLVLAASVALLLYGCYRILCGRYRIDVQEPLLATAVSAGAPAGPLVGRRVQEMVERDSLWEGAREVAREGLARLGADVGGGPAEPAVRVRGSWAQRRGLRRDFGRLWDNAFGRPRRVTAKDLARLVDERDRLEAARAEGRFELDGAEGEGR